MSENMNKPVCGVIYVAVGERCAREAEKSLASLRKTNPALKAMLLTDVASMDPTQWDEFKLDPSLGVQKQNAKSCKGKLNMDCAPWDRCLYLDTDTLVVGDLSPAFALLDRFEFVGEQLGGGHHYQVPGLPSSFPEISGGVLLWRPTEEAKKFFQKWREYYDKYDQSHLHKTFDQMSLRVALWESKLNLGRLPSSYNLMPYFPKLLEGRAVILHGRGDNILRTMQWRSSWSDQWRAYIPTVGEMRHPKEMSWPHIIYTIYRMLAVKLRSVCGL